MNEHPLHLMTALVISLHSKNCWVVLNQLWVKYGQTQPLG